MRTNIGDDAVRLGRLRKAEVRSRQSLVVGSADRLTDDQAFIEAVSIDWDE
jgi:hypothetical protein